jgi:hypothetical protein
VQVFAHLFSLLYPFLYFFNKKRGKAARLAVAQQHIARHLRVIALRVAEVNDCPCYPVCHLVRVARIYFFKHDKNVLLITIS